ncbi:unnamed protein product [Pleuronectes platessa]|uniref:Uncharacterized protein n=1 Tax=Pleuronectes platessa TaxID=8262 RepID=A0A9N7W2S0_PLEPL|nr:unnamed protein product [Pleuronectes platessa]
MASVPSLTPITHHAFPSLLYERPALAPWCQDLPDAAAPLICTHRTHQRCSIIHGWRCCTVSLQHHASEGHSGEATVSERRRARRLRCRQHLTIQLCARHTDVATRGSISLQLQPGFRNALYPNRTPPESVSS